MNKGKAILLSEQLDGTSWNLNRYQVVCKNLSIYNLIYSSKKIYEGRGGWDNTSLNRISGKVLIFGNG